MRYPEFLKENGTIEYVAPSFPVFDQPYTDLYDSAKAKFEALGYQTKEGENIHQMLKVTSASDKDRAAEFMKAYLDQDVDFIHSVAGGEVMLGMLPYLDFNALIHAEPKWFMGFSDNTNLTFLLNTICDVASLYGSNVGSFGMEKWYRSLREAYEIMTGRRTHQKSYKKFAVNDKSHEDGKHLCGYDLTEKSTIYTSTGEDMTLKGRLVGGCLDVLTPLVGTPYDQVAEFSERYADDGILFYLEACDLSPVGVYRALFQLREAGWFDNCSGILFGREHYRDPFFGYTFADAVHDALDETGIPFVYEMDFGHVPPSWTIISGALATVKVRDQKAEIAYKLK